MLQLSWSRAPWNSVELKVKSLPWLSICCWFIPTYWPFLAASSPSPVMFPPVCDCVSLLHPSKEEHPQEGLSLLMIDRRKGICPFVYQCDKQIQCQSFACREDGFIKNFIKMVMFNVSWKKWVFRLFNYIIKVRELGKIASCLHNVGKFNGKTCK